MSKQKTVAILLLGAFVLVSSTWMFKQTKSTSLVETTTVVVGVDETGGDDNHYSNIKDRPAAAAFANVTRARDSGNEGLNAEDRHQFFKQETIEFCEDPSDPYSCRQIVTRKHPYFGRDGSGNYKFTNEELAIRAANQDAWACYVLGHRFYAGNDRTRYLIDAAAYSASAEPVLILGRDASDPTDPANAAERYKFTLIATWMQVDFGDNPISPLTVSRKDLVALGGDPDSVKAEAEILFREMINKNPELGSPNSSLLGMSDDVVGGVS